MLGATRANYFATVLNEDTELEVMLYEAVKALMMRKAIEYFRKYKVSMSCSYASVTAGRRGRADELVAVVRT